MKLHSVENVGNLFFRSMVVTGGLFLASCSDAPEQVEWKEGETIPIFNGLNLDGLIIGTAGGAAGDAWDAVAGSLVSTGKPRGYLHTATSFQDFELTLDWRWASEEATGDCGVLLRIAGEPKSFLPSCVEVNLASGSVGEIRAYHGAKLDDDSDRYMVVEADEVYGDFTGVEVMSDAEKIPGEWNRTKIILKGGVLEVRVNDELVNEATGLEVRSGPVGLQSTGGTFEMDFFQLSPL